MDAVDGGAKGAARGGRVTREEVARLADVSTASVSYVLNNVPNKVSEATAQRIFDAVEKLNYRPSSLGRALKRGSPRMLGIIIPDFSNTYFASMSDALETETSREGYSTIFLCSHGDPEKEKECIAKLASRDVDAILASFALNAIDLATIRKPTVRFVFLDHPDRVPGFKAVGSDFRAASRMATTHLIEHGHRRIAMLFGGDPSEYNDARIQGWAQAHQEAGLATGRIYHTGFTRSGGYEQTLRILDMPETERPTALFAGSDLEAVGALRALHERGLRLPEDMALVSFDGTVDTLYSWPQITSIQQDPVMIAKLAVAAALHPDECDDTQIAPFDFVIRQSCGCHPNAS
ncbi:MAG: LacI family DNA-binding transcriptional regulator [Bifidobacterium psychraerophilum]|uniref:LacI family DNA-binding transcriptional regulator n=1 Tax=Bifidobacterium psychraerophilum TaxID=218140 RepID=UPI0039ED1031